METTNYSLPEFSSTASVDLIGVYNAAMQIIDTKLKSIDSQMGTLSTKVDNVKDSIQVGGTNLWPNSSIISTNAGTGYVWCNASSGLIPVNVGDTLTISCHIDGVKATTGNRGYAYLWAYDSTKTRVANVDAAKSYVLGTLGPQYTVPSGVAYVLAFIGTGAGTSGSVFRGKLEHGNVATDWSPAPADMLAVSAGFLAAHPVGCYYYTSSTANPGQSYGGTWAQVTTSDPIIWHRTA